MTNEELDNARAEEAWNIYNRERSGDVSAIAARLAREGWTPPVAVDPDEGEVNGLLHEWLHDENVTANMMLQKALKRGRELERAEAKPGMVWVKHDGSDVCPVIRDLDILTRNFEGFYGQGCAQWVKWPNVTDYAIITPPEDK